MIVIYPKYTQTQLKIENCTQYAFGQDLFGRSVIWAAGKAGWFEIVPSTRYAPVYEDIVEAVDFIYFLSDAHQSFGSRRPVRGAKVEELLALYQQHTDYRVEDNAEAEAVLEKHHSFLIRQMLESWEGINWARTHIWSYFTRLYPDEVAQVSSAESEVEEDQDAEANNLQQFPEPEDHSVEGLVPSNAEEDQKSWADTIFDEIVQRSGSGHNNKRHSSVDGIAKVLVQDYNVASTEKASMIIRDAAESLVWRLNTNTDRGGNKTWRRKVIYRQLQRLVENEQEHQAHKNIHEMITPAKAPLNRRHHKSILRPSTGAGKGKKRILKAQTPPDDDQREDGAVPDLANTPVEKDTPTKKRRLGSASANAPGRKLMERKTQCAVTTVSTSVLQQEQLDLIRRESVANGRLHVNHLEALIEGLIHEHS